MAVKLHLEIPILLIFFAFMLADYVTTNFILYRTCYVTLGYNISDCALLGSENASEATKDLESIVQPKASVIMMTHTIIDAIIPVFLSMVVGPWSNKHGRKPILISSLIGYFIAFMIFIPLCMFPWISPWWYLISCIAASLGGGICSLLTVTFCYIADVTSNENRGLRMGILDMALTLGSLVGTVSSSFVFHAVGYIGIYSICAAMTFLAILYTFFVLPESLSSVESEGAFKDLIDTSLVVKSVKTCFKPRENKDRIVLCMLISMLTLYILVLFSDSSVFFLFVREKFHWSLQKYTLFSSVNGVVDILGGIFILYFLNKLLKIKDLILLLIGFISLTLSSVIFGFASKDWQIFLGSGIKRLSCVIGPLGRAAISKTIPPEDLGHVFALTTSLESISQLVSAPLYTLLYNSTITTFPSAFNFLSALMYGANIVLTSGVLIIRRMYPTIPYNTVINEQIS